MRATRREPRKARKSALACASSLCRIVGASLLLITLMPATASAAAGRWSSSGPSGESIIAIAVSRSSPSTVYAAARGALFKRASDGSGWTPIPLPQHEGRLVEITDVLVSSLDPSRIVLASNWGAYLSLDGGTSWVNGISHELFRIVEDPSAPWRLFAAGQSLGQGLALFRSTDGGGSWSLMPPVASDFLGDVAVDPADSNVLYGMGGDFLGCCVLIRSTDGGARWSYQSQVLPSAMRILLDRARGADLSGTTIYLGSRGGFGVLKSTDGGQTFTALNPGRTDVTVTGMALDPTDRNLLYVSTLHGVYSSLSGGDDGFARLSAGLPDLPILSLGITPDGLKLYAGTDGGGVIEFEPGGVWLLPSSAHTAGFATDLTLVNPDPVDATYTLKLLGHDVDGAGGLEKSFALPGQQGRTHEDVLGSVFDASSAFGAIQITSSSRKLAISSQTWTMGPVGSFGESVPAFAPARWVSPGSPRILAPIREDAAFRTNLILANALAVPARADVQLFSAAGTRLGSKTYALPPLGMIQVTKVVRDLGLTEDVVDAYLVVAVLGPAGGLAVIATVIDSASDDPRVILP